MPTQLQDWCGTFQTPQAAAGAQGSVQLNASAGLRVKVFFFLFEGISLLKNRTPGPTDPSYKTHNGRADSCRSRYRPRQADGDGRSICDGRHRPRQAGGDGRIACGSCTYRLAEPSLPGGGAHNRAGLSHSCAPLRGPYERAAQRGIAGTCRLRCVARVRHSCGRRRGWRAPFFFCSPKNT